MPQTNPFIDERYNTIFNQLYEPLCRFSIKMVHDSESAEDIVQEQFAYLWENWERLQVVENISSYLYKAVKNHSINYLVKKNNRNTYKELHDVHESFTESNCPSPQELIEKAELEIILEKGINELPERCKDIFTLKKFGELSNKEISEKLYISIKTVEAQTTIALKRIKSYLSEHWEVLTIVVTGVLFNFLSFFLVVF